MENENRNIIYVVLGVVVVLGIVLFLSRGTSSTPTPPAPTPPGPTPPGPTPPGPTPVPPQDFSVCGISRPTAQIIGGTPVANIGKYPWMTFIQFTGFLDESYCTGAVINANWILTAAHCLLNKNASDTICAFGASRNSNQTIDAQLLVPHPDFTDEVYEGGQNLSTFDIALIRLSKPLVFSNVLSPICLPSKQYDFSNTTFIAAGWGLKDYVDTQSFAETLQETTLKADSCSASTAFADKKICTVNTVGAVGVGSPSPCRGDSGGPLMLLDNGKYVAVGVSSYGVRKCQFGVYTNVFSYLDFINQTVAKNP
jgi:secreted trypsin-like serine protease